jgi:hypothetical protein
METGMPPPKRKTLTPRQKKDLSLQKDRRGDYGESDKGSRKTVPRFKRAGLRAARHADKVHVEQGVETMDALLDGKLKRRKRKEPDAPLGRIIEKQQVERTYLNRTAGQGPRGRRRAQ